MKNPCSLPVRKSLSVEKHFLSSSFRKWSGLIPACLAWMLLCSVASAGGHGRILIPDEVKVSSNGAEYDSSALVDGVRDSVYWRDAWASAMAARPQWAELLFESPVSIEAVAIHWNVEDGYPVSSRNYKIQAWSDDDYVDVVDVTDSSPVPRSLHTFDRVTTDRIRVWQPEGGGHHVHSNVMWIAEIEVYDYPKQDSEFGSAADMEQVRHVLETVRDRTIGVFPRTRRFGGRTGAIARPLQKDGWRVIGLDRLDKRELERCRVVAIAARRHIPNRDKLLAYIHNGGSVLFVHDSCGRGGGGSLLPGIWEFKGMGEGMLEIIDSSHPVTEGASGSFVATYGDHARLRAARRGKALVRDADGYDVVVAGSVGRGKAVAIGHFPGMSTAGTEWSEHRIAAPEGAERKLLLNSVRWLVEGGVQRDSWRETFALRRALRRLHSQTQPIFEDMTEACGMNYYGYSKGVMMADINNNGRLDIFATVNPPSSWPWANARKPYHNLLYRNDGDWNFTETAAEAGVTDPSGIGAVFGDINRSGNLDLFVSWLPEMGAKGRGTLYAGDGKGGFTDITEASGLGDVGKTSLCMFADVNNNGHLDLYLTGFRAENKLYINRGDGTFEDKTEEFGLSGLGAEGEGGYGGNQAALMADLDNDGFVDLVLFSERVLRIFRNEDGKKFREITDYMGEGNPPVEGRSLGLAVGDINNNGLLDLYATRVNVLLRNKGDMQFEDITAEAGLEPMQRNIRPYGAKFVDWNNSGWLDLFLATGGFDSFAFENNGDGTFTDVTATIGLDVQAVHGFNFGDLDGDGDLDFYATAWRKRPFVLLRNNLNDGNSITVRVKGHQTNPSGVGTKIWVYEKCEDAGRVLRGYREVRAGGGSMYSGAILQQHIGLGSGTGPYTVEALFPVSGQRVEVSGIVPHAIIEIEEPVEK